MPHYSTHSSGEAANSTVLASQGSPSTTGITAVTSAISTGDTDPNTASFPDPRKRSTSPPADSYTSGGASISREELEHFAQRGEPRTFHMDTRAPHGGFLGTAGSMGERDRSREDPTKPEWSGSFHHLPESVYLDVSEECSSEVVDIWLGEVPTDNVEGPSHLQAGLPRQSSPQRLIDVQSDSRCTLNGEFSQLELVDDTLKLGDL